jgi:hypothetical protein
MARLERLDLRQGKPAANASAGHDFVDQAEVELVVEATEIAPDGCLETETMFFLTACTMRRMLAERGLARTMDVAARPEGHDVHGWPMAGRCSCVGQPRVL